MFYVADESCLRIARNVSRAQLVFLDSQPSIYCSCRVSGVDARLYFTYTSVSCFLVCNVYF